MNETIKEKLSSTINNSQAFKLMVEADQMRFQNILNNASDEQATQAIALLDQHEQIYLQNEQAKAAQAEKLNQEIKTADKFIAQQDEADDQAKELQKLASIEAAILDIPPSSSK